MTSTPVLELRDVSKSFFVRKIALRALSNVDLAVAPGETVGLIGESGSGKTTIGRVALGLTPPDEGVAAFLGEPWPKRARRGEPPSPRLALDRVPGPRLRARIPG